MLYWDASALAALCVQQECTAQLRELVASGGSIVTWSVSRVEIASMIEARSHERCLDPEARLLAMTMLGELAEAWTEVHSLAAVCDRATRLLAMHPLGPAGSMQLAAALVAVADRPRGHTFVSTDRRLREAASREGFRVLPESLPARRPAQPAREPVRIGSALRSRSRLTIPAAPHR